jgi:hypothetical protein
MYLYLADLGVLYAVFNIETLLAGTLLVHFCLLDPNRNLRYPAQIECADCEYCVECAPTGVVDCLAKREGCDSLFCLWNEHDVPWGLGVVEWS